MLARSTRRRMLGAATAAALLLALSTTPAQAAGPRYVALGDSYASGEGLAPYETGSATDTACHRSTKLSYPELLEASPLPAFDSLNSVACSGAPTTAMLFQAEDGSTPEPQLSALSRHTTTVTLTIGGNDVGFSSVLTDCIYIPPSSSPEQRRQLPGRPDCRLRHDARVSARIAHLGAPKSDDNNPSIPLLPLLVAIHTFAPNAQIYVTGYPQLFGTAFNHPQGCRVGGLGQIPLVVKAADALWMREKVRALNATIRGSVSTAARFGVPTHFVDVSRDFAGHGLCDTGTAWVNGVVLTQNPFGVSPASFHPTARGQLAYAGAVARASLD